MLVSDGQFGSKLSRVDGDVRGNLDHRPDAHERRTGAGGWWLVPATDETYAQDNILDLPLAYAVTIQKVA